MPEASLVCMAWVVATGTENILHCWGTNNMHENYGERSARRMLRGFKDFIAKGNVLDLAVAFVLGLAFGRIITSFVNDVLMPPIGLLLGRVDFANLFINLSGRAYPSLAAARAAGAPVIAYGSFLNTIIDFLVVAFALYLIVRRVNRYRNLEAPPKACPYCFSKIPAQATRCPECTSDLGETPGRKAA